MPKDDEFFDPDNPVEGFPEQSEDSDQEFKDREEMPPYPIDGVTEVVSMRDVEEDDGA